MEAAGDDDRGERSGPRRAPSKCLDQCRDGPVEIFVAASDDDRDGNPDPSEGRPATVGPVVGKEVLSLPGSIEAQVAPSAPEAECSGDQPVWIARGEAPGDGDAPPELRGADLLHLRGDIGDGTEKDQSAHPTVAGPGRIVEDLVGAGRVPGQDDRTVAGPAGKRDRGTDVLDALREALECRALEAPPSAYDNVVPTVVELEIGNAHSVESPR